MTKQIEIKVPTFREWVAITKLKGTIEDKIGIVKTMTNVEDIDKLSIEDFTLLLQECYEILNRVDPKLDFTIDDKKYIVNPDWTKWNFRQWIDIDYYLNEHKGNEIMAAPYIAFILSCFNYSSEDSSMSQEIGDKWMDEEFTNFIPVYNFFLQKEIQSQKLTQHYLQVEDLILQQVQQLENLTKDGAGLSPLRTYLMEITVNKIISSVFPHKKSSTISLLELIKVMQMQLKLNILNNWKKLKDKIYNLGKKIL